MSKLSVDQQSVLSLFSDKKADFLIPDYQRPYAWTEEECETLWDDIFNFAFPNNNKDNFNGDDEYYLGPIVTFKNDDGKQEIIDGQQRLTTLMLLLRAFYVKFGEAMDNNTVETRKKIASCIWKTDEFGNPNKNELKINSEVATDNDKEEFLQILKSGKTTKEQESKYARNYRFFQSKINDFADRFSMYVTYFPIRVLNNCILLPIEADNQDTALRIFSTLNDRGMPLSDSDIFKAQFYNYYKSLGKKDEFIKTWKKLENDTKEIFPFSNAPMNELFTRYMYYERAKKRITSSTTEALRKFYETNKYELLKNEDTLKNLVDLSDFWKDVNNQNEERFDDEILKRLYVLNYSPNGMWNYLLSVYYLQNRDLERNKLLNFLNKIIAFTFAYYFINPGVNALRTPVYKEMIKIIDGKDVDFREYLFDENSLRTTINNFEFSNQRTITKSMLTWWAFENPNQQLMYLDEYYEIEHIYAKNRENNEHQLMNKKNIESLGNKAILEKRINIRASDYRFEDKKKYYLGYTNNRGQRKEKTSNQELIDLTQKNDFTESDIENRFSNMINKFIDYLKKEKLIKYLELGE